MLVNIYYCPVCGKRISPEFSYLAVWPSVPNHLRCDLPYDVACEGVGQMPKSRIAKSKTAGKMTLKDE